MDCDEAFEEGFESGMNGIEVKPIMNKRLETVLEEHLFSKL
jgi:hypothetical protein